MRKPVAIIGDVLPHIFKKAVTCRYPLVKAQIPENSRGKLVCFASKCVGCKICMRDCPTGAIAVIKVAEKQFEISVDLARCIYCAQCVDSCPRKVLATSREFELASLDRTTLSAANIDASAPASVTTDPTRSEV